jgi:hypothetical protein
LVSHGADGDRDVSAGSARPLLYRHGLIISV